MECRSCAEALTALMDQELEADEAREVEDHLAGCTDCRSEWESLRLAGDYTAALPHLVATDHLWERIAQDIAPPAPPARGWLLGLLKTFDRPWIPLVAASAAVVIIAGVFVQSPAPTLESDFASFIRQRERISVAHTEVLLANDPSDWAQRSRNPFVKPAFHSSKSPFQE